MLFHATATFETAAQRGVTRKAIVPRRELTERTEEKRRVAKERAGRRRGGRVDFVDANPPRYPRGEPEDPSEGWPVL